MLSFEVHTIFFAFEKMLNEPRNKTRGLRQRTTLCTLFFVLFCFPARVDAVWCNDFPPEYRIQDRGANPFKLKTKKKNVATLNRTFLCCAWRLLFTSSNANVAELLSRLIGLGSAEELINS
jgi:hypothetical protein